MAKWIEYTGSDEQLEEIEFTKDVLGDFDRWLKAVGITNYPACQPHPHADIIKIWADTGCPVWVRAADLCYEDNKSNVWERYGLFVTVTDTPDWNIPGAEYSLTPFGD